MVVRHYAFANVFSMCSAEHTFSHTADTDSALIRIECNRCCRHPRNSDPATRLCWTAISFGRRCMIVGYAAANMLDCCWYRTGVAVMVVTFCLFPGCRHSLVALNFDLVAENRLWMNSPGIGHSRMRLVVAASTTQKYKHFLMLLRKLLNAIQPRLGNCLAFQTHLRTLHRYIFRAVAMHRHVHAHVDAHAGIHWRRRRRGYVLMLLIIALIIVVIDGIVSVWLRLRLARRH